MLVSELVVYLLMSLKCSVKYVFSENSNAENREVNKYYLGYLQEPVKLSSYFIFTGQLRDNYSGDVDNIKFWQNLLSLQMN